MNYLVPGGYFFASRAKNIEKKIAFLIVYILPILYLCAYFGRTNNYFAINFLLAYFCVMSLYEIGYIFNDVITTKHEEYPNIRLSVSQHQKITDNYKKLCWRKLIIACICLALVYFFEAPYFFQFFFALIIMMIFFFIHNKIRSRLNIITYFFLCNFKYITFLSLFISMKDIVMPISIVNFCFVIIRTFEHSQKLKYNLRIDEWIKIDIGLQRVIYSGFILILATALFIANFKFVPFVIVALWLFTYRVIAYILNKRLLKKDT